VLLVELPGAICAVCLPAIAKSRLIVPLFLTLKTTVPAGTIGGASLIVTSFTATATTVALRLDPALTESPRAPIGAAARRAPPTQRHSTRRAAVKVEGKRSDRDDVDDER